MERRTKNMFRCLLYLLLTAAVLHVVTADCTLAVNEDLGQPQPIYLRGNAYLEPSDNLGNIHLNKGDEVQLACVGVRNVINHPDFTQTQLVPFLTVKCVNGVNFSIPRYQHKIVEFQNLVCSNAVTRSSLSTSESCNNEGNKGKHGNYKVIEVGYTVGKVMYPVYTSCFDKDRLEVLYVEYELGPKNMAFQEKVKSPNWAQGSHFKKHIVDELYNENMYKAEISKLIGEGPTNWYINGKQILTRGHLAAKADFVLANMQRSTFYFVNAAPQFHSCNNGNWKSLEMKLRQHIGMSGNNTKIYAGTFGVTQLRNESGVLTDIYLHERVIPVPLYFFKVVHDTIRKLATAFVSINNPYYNENDMENLIFCNDVCRENGNFSWLTWDPDNKTLGYSFCCTMEEFRRTVDHIPYFEVNGLLT